MNITKETLLIEKFYKSKLIFNLYDYLTQIYSRTMSALEKIFFRKGKSSSDFERIGIIKFKSRFNANDLNYLYSDIISKDSSSIKVIERESLDFFLNKIFSEEIRKEITTNTGFKYSIDYFKVFENKNILNDNRKYHFDKSFSRNMLKVFIPLNICNYSGPLKVYDKISSKKIRKQKNLNNCKYTLIKGAGEFIYCLSPNTCFHKEGNPKDGFTSLQIMFQLNPSNVWSYRNDLYKRQFLRENKFTSFNSLLSKNKFFEE